MVARDYHVHSNYSDGAFLWQMVGAAEDAGLDALGFADHCTVSERPARIRERDRNGFTLDETHERRRDALADVAETTAVTLYDGVEMDYHPGDEAAVAEFLADADFDYAVGSVHHLDGVNVHVADHFASKSERDRRALVDRYFEKLVALVESELFDVAAHLDLVERTPALRGLASREQYDRVADALADSRTLPEINAGRALSELGEYHPGPSFLDALIDRGVAFVVGSDAHAPAELRDRHEALPEALADRGVEPVSLDL
ncbi:MAG: PHP domain-containing protein [Halolamina sp.]